MVTPVVLTSSVPTLILIPQRAVPTNAVSISGFRTAFPENDWNPCTNNMV